MSRLSEEPIPRREYKNGEMLSIVGFGGILCLGHSLRETSALVSEVRDRGINYFDVAPSYGGGEAEEKLGPALEPYRSMVFLACKTMRRDAEGAQEDLERSLKRMRTDHFDLYQLHAVTAMKEVDEIFDDRGAIGTVVRAREKGLVRYIGFSAHSEEAALAMLDRFSFDSILFPFNIVCSANGHFGPRVMEHAKEKGVARLALKAMAYSPWSSKGDHPWPKCWYRPIDDPVLARLALRFTLSEDVTAAIPPGEEALFRIAMEGAAKFTPLSADERKDLVGRINDVQPLFKKT
ncbi:MAG: putative oxidoreductase of the aldo/keto reductase family [Bacteroidetes bacterium]|nr:putative oxidoreductase of the aldo/keto reductase family [Bacteroidota bacterium]